MANIKVKFKEAYQDFGAYALLKNVTDKGVLIVDGTEVLNSIADLPTTNTVDGQEKAVIVQNGQVVTTSISNIGGESGGDFIPLSGTEVGNPVTGDIDMANSNLIFNNIDGDKFIKFGYNPTTDETGFWYNNGIDAQTRFHIYNGAIQSSMPNGSNISFANIGLGLDGNGDPLYRGVIGAADYTANITDLDYTQKIYVDTHIAFIPIPTSSTDSGKKGQMAVDATYLYICVDTDTWTRVALAW